MKRFLVVALCYFATIGMSMAQHDATSKKILDQFSANYKTAPSIESEFTFTLENKEEDIKEANEGKIVIKKEAYRLNMMSMEIFVDGTTNWTYMPDAMEVNVSSLEDTEGEVMNPATIFSIYEEGFSSTYKGEEGVNGKNTHVIELLPTEQQVDIISVRLYISKTDSHLVRAVTQGNDGNQYIIDIKSINNKKTFDDSYFVFDTSKYPDVDVIDMR